MRAYSLALIVFIFMLSISFVSSAIITDAGVTSMEIGGQTPEAWSDSNSAQVDIIAGSPTDEATTGDADFSWYNNVYKPVVIGIPFVVGIFVDCTFGLYGMLQVIGVPNSLALLLSTIAWFIYIVGMIQWITNRGFKQNN